MASKTDLMAHCGVLKISLKLWLKGTSDASSSLPLSDDSCFGSERHRHNTNQSGVQKRVPCGGLQTGLALSLA